MKAIDIRTETAVKLLAEFLDMDTSYREEERHTNAEHFAHGKLQFRTNHFCVISHIGLEL